jgi:hypothetical protein
MRNQRVILCGLALLGLVFTHLVLVHVAADQETLPTFVDRPPAALETYPGSGIYKDSVSDLMRAAIARQTQEDWVKYHIAQESNLGIELGSFYLKAQNGKYVELALYERAAFTVFNGRPERQRLATILFEGRVQVSLIEYIELPANIRSAFSSLVVTGEPSRTSPTIKDLLNHFSTVVTGTTSAQYVDRLLVPGGASNSISSTMGIELLEFDLPKSTTGYSVPKKISNGLNKLFGERAGEITGLPLGPAIWMNAKVNKSEVLVAVQVFERVIATYNPKNNEANQVQIGLGGATIQQALARTSQDGQAEITFVDESELTLSYDDLLRQDGKINIRIRAVYTGTMPTVSVQLLDLVSSSGGADLVLTTMLTELRASASATPSTATSSTATPSTATPSPASMVTTTREIFITYQLALNAKPDKRPRPGTYSGFIEASSAPTKIIRRKVTLRVPAFELLGLPNSLKAVGNTQTPGVFHPLFPDLEGLGNHLPGVLLVILLALWVLLLVGLRTLNAWFLSLLIICILALAWATLINTGTSSTSEFTWRKVIFLLIEALLVSLFMLGGLVWQNREQNLWQNLMQNLRENFRRILALRVRIGVTFVLIFGLGWCLLTLWPETRVTPTSSIKPAIVNPIELTPGDLPPPSTTPVPLLLGRLVNQYGETGNVWLENNAITVTNLLRAGTYTGTLDPLPGTTGDEVSLIVNVADPAVYAFLMIALGIILVWLILGVAKLSHTAKKPNNVGPVAATDTLRVLQPQTNQVDFTIGLSLGVFVVITGFIGVYFTNGSWGSQQDYWNAFIWGFTFFGGVRLLLSRLSNIVEPQMPEGKKDTK